MRKRRRRRSIYAPGADALEKRSAFHTDKLTNKHRYVPLTLAQRAALVSWAHA